MSKENQRIAITKRLLQEALMRLLEKKDIAKVNITELCSEAGINRVTFYRHYEMPHDVLMEMERNLLDDLQRTCPMPQTMSDFKQYLEDICTYLDTHIDVLKLMVQNNSDQDFYLLFSDVLHKHWQSSVLSTMLGEPDPETMNILSVYYAGGGYFIMRQWLLGNIRKTPREIAAIFYDLLCRTNWAAISSQLEHQ